MFIIIYNKYLLVMMRLWETLVPLPNTIVKTYTVDGTLLVTTRESRWLPAFFLNKIYGLIAQLVRAHA